MEVVTEISLPIRFKMGLNICRCIRLVEPLALVLESTCVFSAIVQH